VKATFWDGLKDIVDTHEKGTKYDIYVDQDGLLEHGSRLTWMDAENDGVAVTSRAGKAVETQALWYNALRIGEILAKRMLLQTIILQWRIRLSRALIGSFGIMRGNAFLMLWMSMVMISQLGPTRSLLSGLISLCWKRIGKTLLLTLLWRSFLLLTG
jgi:hypothetical protein